MQNDMPTKKRHCGLSPEVSVHAAFHIVDDGENAFFVLRWYDAFESGHHFFKVDKDEHDVYEYDSPAEYA